MTETVRTGFNQDAAHVGVARDPKLTVAPVGKGNHIVEAGECLASIAHAHGFFWETLWDLPENEELRREREDPNMLLPGDRVMVPPPRAKSADAPVDRRHRFRRRGVPEKLRLRFLDADQQPRAGLVYKLDLAGKVQDGALDDDGYLEVWIPPQEVRARLAFLHPETEQTIDYYELDIGHLPPIDSGEGIAARLANLGLLSPGGDLHAAIADFQREHQLDPSGSLDAPTRAKLREAAGS